MPHESAQGSWKYWLQCPMPSYGRNNPPQALQVRCSLRAAQFMDMEAGCSDEDVSGYSFETSTLCGELCQTAHVQMAGV